MDNSSIEYDTGTLARGITHSRVNQEILKTVAEEAIDSAANIIQKIADQLNIDEAVIVRKIKELKRRRGFISSLDDATREIINALLKVEDTHNYYEDVAKMRNKIIKAENPNMIFISR